MSQGTTRKTVRAWWAALAAAVLCLTFIGVPASAQNQARVALITSDPDASSTRRLEAELRELGVEVEIIEPDPSEPIGRATLERIARKAGAFAAIRVVPIAAEVEVWVADRVTGKTVVREVLRGDEHSSVDDAIAVGAVELLRASLLEVAASTQLRGDVPPPPAVERMVPPLAAVKEDEEEEVVEPEPQETEPGIHALEPPQLSPKPEPTPQLPPSLALALEPAIDTGIGGMPVGVQGQLLLRTPMVGDISAELLTLFPVSPAELEGEEGKAELSTRWYGVGALWAPALKVIRPNAGLSLTAIRVEAWGSAAAPYVSQRQHAWVLAPTLRLGASLPLSSVVRLRVDATGAFSLRSIPIYFADRKAAQWGRPALVLGAGFEVALPLVSQRE